MMPRKNGTYDLSTNDRCIIGLINSEQMGFMHILVMSYYIQSVSMT